MDMVELPLVPDKMPLGEALRLLKDDQKSGLVVDHGSELVLLETSDLTRAWNSAVDREEDPRQQPVGSIRPRPRKVELPSGLGVELEGAARHASISLELGNRLRVVFDRQPPDDRHVILRAAAAMARVIASSKEFTTRLGRSSVTCTCAGPEPDVHTFTKDEVDVEGQCNYPHAARLTCDDDF